MQGRAIDAAERHAAIERQSPWRLPGFDVAADLAAADPAFDAVDNQRLAVALHGARERSQLAAARQHATQCLKRDLSTPAPEKTVADRVSRVVPGRAQHQCE